MEDYRQKFGATRFAKGEDAEIGAKIATRKKKVSDRNDEARRLLPLAKKEITAGNFEARGDHAAAHRDLAETDYVKSNLTQVKSYKKSATSARVSPRTSSWRWTSRTSGQWQLPAARRRERVRGAPARPEVARLTIPAAPASTTRSSHDARAESISFWAGAGKSSATQMELYLHDDTGNNTLTLWSM